MGFKVLLTLVTTVYKSVGKMFRFHMIANIVLCVVTKVVANIANKVAAVITIFHNIMKQV